MTKTPTQILTEARDMIVRPYGWSKRDFVRTQTRVPYPAYCLVGAIEVAAGVRDAKTGGNKLESFKDNPAIQPLVIAEIELEASGKFWSLIPFNDSPITKKDDVVALLDRSIERSKKKVRKPRVKKDTDG